jgi:hypothetical protein
VNNANHEVPTYADLSTLLLPYLLDPNILLRALSSYKLSLVLPLMRETNPHTCTRKQAKLYFSTFLYYNRSAKIWSAYMIYIYQFVVVFKT